MRALLYVSFVAAVACAPDSDRGSAEGDASAFVADSVILDIPGTVSADSSAFVLAVSAVRLPDGRIVVADLYDASVRYFDASGRLTRIVGRRGDGPGEFQSVGWVGRCATDSVFVWDAALFRLTVLDAAGEVARTTPIAGSPAVAACSGTGTLAAFAGERTTSRSGPEVWTQRYAGPLWLLDAEGDTVRPLGEVPMGELRPLGRVTRLAMSNDRLYVGTADSAFVDVYSLDGQRQPALAVGIADRAPTRRDFERAVDAMVRPYPDRGAREETRNMLLDIPIPERIPPYDGLFADPAGTLWVATWAAADGNTRLRAIDPGGSVLGDLELPVELNVFEIGEDYVLGAYEDDGGEQHIAMYRLRRRG